MHAPPRQTKRRLKKCMLCFINFCNSLETPKSWAYNGNAGRPVTVLVWMGL